MLLVHRNAQDHLEAGIEWQLVNEQGQLDPLGGKFVWVEQLEVNQDIDARRTIRMFVEQIAGLAPQAVWGYWLRKKNPTRKTRLYSRTQLLTFARRGAYASLASS